MATPALEQAGTHQHRSRRRRQRGGADHAGQADGRQRHHANAEQSHADTGGHQHLAAVGMLGVRPGGLSQGLEFGFVVVRHEDLSSDAIDAAASTAAVICGCPCAPRFDALPVPP
jgi:hypothetical protein